MTLSLQTRRSCIVASGARASPLVPQFRSRRSVRLADSERSSNETAASSSSEVKEEVPIWVRREAERLIQEKEGNGGFPWGLYLLFSTFTAIAAVGCIFEFIDKNPFFGIIPVESPFWAPVLLTLAVTGFPTSGFLFYKGVTGFNDAAERQDKIDGYLDRD